MFFLFVFFLVDEGRDDPNTTISGPTSACQRFSVIPMMAQHIMLAWYSVSPSPQKGHGKVSRKRALLARDNRLRGHF